MLRMTKLIHGHASNQKKVNAYSASAMVMQKREWPEQGYDRGLPNWQQVSGNKRGRFDGALAREHGRGTRGPPTRDAPHFGGPPRFGHPMQKGPAGMHPPVDDAYSAFLSLYTPYASASLLPVINQSHLAQICVYMPHLDVHSGVRHAPSLPT